MSDTIEVVVEKVAGSGMSAGKAFVSNKVWYNYKRGKDVSKLPSDIIEGVTITILDPYEGKSGSIYFTKYSVLEEVKPVSSASKTFVKKAVASYGGMDDAKQRLIVRQNALTNTCNLVAAGKVSANQIAITVDHFTNIVFETDLEDAVVEEEASVEKKAAPKSASKKKAEPVVMEEEDEEDPFAMD